MRNAGIYCTFSGFSIVAVEKITSKGKWNVRYFKDYSAMSYMKIKEEMQEVARLLRETPEWFSNAPLDFNRSIKVIELDIQKEILKLISLVNDGQISFDEKCQAIKAQIAAYDPQVENRQVGCLMLALHKDPRDFSWMLASNH